MHSASLVLAQAGGAGGAPLADLVGATIVGGAMGLVAFAIGGLHRAHRIHWLGRLAAFSERVSGLPRWAALPAAIGGGALLMALFGFWWDVATHIDNGRDRARSAPPPFGRSCSPSRGSRWPAFSPSCSAALTTSRPPYGCAVAGRRRWAASCWPRAAALRCSASRSTTRGIASSARTSRSGVRRTCS